MNGKIFINYRREESRWSARILYDRLSARFDRKQIFMDIDGIAPGDDFVEVIEQRVGECDVLIAVIGTHWLTSTNEREERRLDNPEDFVRMEIATALTRAIRVIPVLVDGASMPRSTDLPDNLKGLARRNAVRVSDTGFDDDCRRLILAIEQVLEKNATEQREKKERLESEQKQREEEKQRFEAVQRERERLEAEQQQSEARERAQAKSLEAEQGQREKQERPEVGSRQRAEEEGFAAERQKVWEAGTQGKEYGPRTATEEFEKRERGHSFKDENDKRIRDTTEDIRRNPDHAEAYYWRGRAYHDEQCYDEAISDYNKGIRLMPDDAESYYWRGNAYRDKQCYDEAISDYTEAIRLIPFESTLYHLCYEARGRVYQSQGRHVEAAGDFAMAIALK
jgi:tetratricopeptide (TPR) repeat protein